MVDWQVPPDPQAGEFLRRTHIVAWRDDLTHLKERLDRVYTAAAAFAAGDVGALQTNGQMALASASAAAPAGVYGIALTALANGQAGYFATTGYAVVNVTGTVTVGTVLVPSSTAGKATALGTPTAGTVPLGVAVTAPANNQVVARLAPLAPRDLPPLPAAVVYRSTNQTIANATVTAISFDTAVANPVGWWSASQPTRCTVDRAGLYHCWAMATFAANSTGRRQIQLQLNGSTILGLDLRLAIAGLNTVVAATALWRLAANDYLEGLVYQNSGAALALDATFLAPRLGAVWLGP